MSILSSIGRMAMRYAATRARYRGERALHSLPDELRKDIGWPEVSDAEDGHRTRIATLSSRIV